MIFYSVSKSIVESARNLMPLIMPKNYTLQVLKKRTAAGSHRWRSRLDSGAFSDITKHVDQRSLLAKSLRQMKDSLIQALGSDPSPQEEILINRIVYKAHRCVLFEIKTISEGRSEHTDTDSYYLSWSNSLRADLQTLGLQRRAKEIQETLETYLTSHYGNSEEHT